MKKLSIFIVCAITAVLMTGCCGCRLNSNKQVKQLLETRWKLTELGTTKTLAASDADSYTLSFEPKEGRIFGKADCNRYFGGYVIKDKNSVSFTNTGATRMMCPNDSNEQQFLMMLSKVNGFVIDGSKLVLMNDGSTLAVFEPVKE